MSARLLAPLVVLCLLLLAVPAPRVACAEDEADPVSLDTAEIQLGILKQMIGSSKSQNEEIIGQLEAVGHAYANLQEPVKPKLKEVPADASEDEQKAIEKENNDALSAYKSAMTKHGRRVAKFRKAADKLFIKAVKLSKIHHQSESNIRDDVNITAARVIGGMGSEDLADDLMNALDKTVFKSKVDATQTFLDTAFAALAQIGSKKAFVWMTKNFTHAKASPEVQVHRLIAAHQALVLFDREKVQGKLRYQLVDSMVTTYSGVESQALQSSADPGVRAKREFWDTIKNYTVKAVQYYTFEPKNEDGEVLATMEEFRRWFGDHKNQRKAPWKDEKPAPAKE